MKFGRGCAERVEKGRPFAGLCVGSMVFTRKGAIASKDCVAITDRGRVRWEIHQPGSAAVSFGIMCAMCLY
jgi:hypothetical protein